MEFIDVDMYGVWGRYSSFIKLTFPVLDHMHHAA